MSFYRLRILFGICPIILLFCTSIIAQSDTSIILQEIGEVRSFDPEALGEYRSDPAFSYSTVAQQKESLWSRIKQWLWSKFDPSDENMSLISKILLYTFLALIVGYLVFYFSKIEGNALFTRSGKVSRLHAEILNEKIDMLSIDQHIANARAEGKLNLAFRYMYIKVLFLLDSAELIKLEKFKTNGMYRQEFANEPLAPAFEKLASYFEYTWFGEYPVTQEDFTAMEENYKALTDQIRKV